MMPPNPKHAKGEQREAVNARHNAKRTSTGGPFQVINALSFETSPVFPS